VKNKVFEVVKEFSSLSHGSTNYDKDEIFIMGASVTEYVPFSYLVKKLPEIKTVENLQALDFMYSSLSFLENREFDDWYSKQFNKKINQKIKKNVGIIHLPDTKKIFDTVEVINQVYEILKESRVLNNGKNLPVQLGEWYAKMIFGLKQVKSSSQRGFDFYSREGKMVEVKIHWHDLTSPKGVKIKKSLADLSDYCIIMYVAKNFMIRDILLLDSEFILRKFPGKGHTVFLKDTDVASYFFSRSNKHYDKIVNKSALMRFAGPNFAMKLDGKLI
jgi:hypothetical protein